MREEEEGTYIDYDEMEPTEEAVDNADKVKEPAKVSKPPPPDARTRPSPWHRVSKDMY